MSREIDILNKISVGGRYEGTPHSRSAGRIICVFRFV